MAQRSVAFLSCLIVGLLSYYTGTSYWTRPDYEVSYQTSARIWSCIEKSCVASFTLVVGNSGVKGDQTVTVVIDPEIDRLSLHPPKIRTGGVSKRRSQITQVAGGNYYQLGSIEPGHLVTMSWMFMAASADKLPMLSDSIIRVEASRGIIRRGDPQGIAFLRFLVSLSAIF